MGYRRYFKVFDTILKLSILNSISSITNFLSLSDLKICPINRIGVNKNKKNIL